ncbi:DUF5994 family protein [Streptomyces sp. NPDC059112]|uniref:DUF5994 family protein n=1 Tax=Streptomyces sp. NPDC059112 TaxID=3346730 RepID=UPI0036979D4C
MARGAWNGRGQSGSQLPDLIDALTAGLEPVARVGPDASAWIEVPLLLAIGDHTVRIDRSGAAVEQRTNGGHGLPRPVSHRD